MITPDDDDNDDDDDDGGGGENDGDDQGAYEFDTRASRGDNDSEVGDQVLADVAEEEAVQVPQTGSTHMSY